MPTHAPIGRLLPLLAGAAVALAACASSTPTSRAAATGSHTTVAVRSTDVGVVLTDSAGRTLYSSEQEKGTVRCTSSSCTTVWQPLTLAGGTQPTGPRQVSSGLSTVRRPDGHTQVTFDGRPLYTFSFDRSAGQVGGNGVADSFDGTKFTWHAAMTRGAPQPSSTPSPSGGYTY
jgi:predicted lipoprotein with Yx(FWY)xxD motif